MVPLTESHYSFLQLTRTNEKEWGMPPRTFMIRLRRAPGFGGRQRRR